MNKICESSSKLAYGKDLPIAHKHNTHILIPRFPGHSPHFTLSSHFLCLHWKPWKPWMPFVVNSKSHSLLWPNNNNNDNRKMILRTRKFFPVTPTPISSKQKWPWKDHGINIMIIIITKKTKPESHHGKEQAQITWHILICVCVMYGTPARSEYYHHPLGWPCCHVQILPSHEHWPGT